MCRNCHDGTCTVTCKNVLRNPYRNLLASERIHSIRTCEYTCNFSGLSHSLTLSLLLGFKKVSLNSLFLSFGCKFCNPLALWSKDHESNAEHSIRTGGEDCHVILSALTLCWICICNLEDHLSTLRLSNPVLLHLLKGICPLKLLHISQKSLSICRNSKLPLFHHLLLNRMSSTN